MSTLYSTSINLGSSATQDTGTGANNIVQLDSNAKLPAVDGSQLINLPNSNITGALVYKGVYNASTSSPSLVTAKKGDFYKVSVAGSLASVSLSVNDHIVFNQDSANPVTSAMFDVVDNSETALATVATTGSYNDLNNKPVLATGHDNIIFLDANRSDTYTEDGSYQFPYKTFTSAWSALDTTKDTLFYFNAGSYAVSLTDATAMNKKLSFIGQSKESVILSPSNIATDCFKLTDKTGGLFFKDLTIQEAKYGIRIINGTKVSIDNVFFYKCGSTGVVANHDGSKSQSDQASVWASNATSNGGACRIQNITGHVILKNNCIEYCLRGYRVQDCTGGGYIINNETFRTLESAIYLASSTYDGTDTNGSSDFEILNNNINEPANNGILLIGGRNNVVKDNVIRGAWNSPVMMFSTLNTIIDSNRIIDSNKINHNGIGNLGDAWAQISANSASNISTTYGDFVFQSTNNVMTECGQGRLAQSYKIAINPAYHIDNTSAMNYPTNYSPLLQFSSENDVSDLTNELYTQNTNITEKSLSVLATVATSGSYNDLSNTPSLATVATTGSYNDLSNTPSLATVATSGSYNDLSNTPSLATVATSGSYNDLSNTPSLATVATSGSYNDLSSKPTLGTSASLDAGTSATNVVQLDSNAKLPAVDGSQLTNLPAGGATDLNGLTDVTISSVASGDTLVYNGTNFLNVEPHREIVELTTNASGYTSSANEFVLIPDGHTASALIINLPATAQKGSSVIVARGGNTSSDNIRVKCSNTAGRIFVYDRLTPTGSHNDEVFLDSFSSVKFTLISDSGSTEIWYADFSLNTLFPLDLTKSSTGSEYKLNVANNSILQYQTGEGATNIGAFKDVALNTLALSSFNNDLNIGNLGDVSISSASNNQVLKYNGSAWVNATDAGGATQLNELSDVVVTSPANHEVIVHNGVNFTNAELNYNQLINKPTTDQISEGSTNKYYTDARARSHIEGQDLDLGSNKVLYANMYSALNDLPSASTYHGMFAHVHSSGKGYYAHGGAWVQLANDEDLGFDFVSVDNADVNPIAISTHYSTKATTQNVVLTMPALSADNHGKEIRVKFADKGGSYNIELSASSDTIEGSSSNYVISAEKQSVTLVANNTAKDWEIV
tara:strand:+ start:553 stop:3936 length:3384 start_codon:yes stop_codon:yes gene_type:complete